MGKLAAKHRNSFIYVVEEVRIETFQSFLVNNKRDFDALEESLGIFFN